jgi:hypothetical protein
MKGRSKSGGFPLTVTQQVLTAKDTLHYMIRRSDWQAIRRHVNQIDLPDSAYQNAGWASVGVGVSAFLTAITLAPSSTSAWVRPTCWVLFAAAGLFAWLCHRLTASHRTAISRSKQVCMTELDEIEKMIDPGAQSS